MPELTPVVVAERQKAAIVCTRVCVADSAFGLPCSHAPTPQHGRAAFAALDTGMPGALAAMMTGLARTCDSGSVRSTACDLLDVVPNQRAKYPRKAFAFAGPKT